MKDVFEGKQIMIEWVSLVEVLLEKYLSRQNGEYLVHYTDEFITPVQGGTSTKVVMMNKINPWTERFCHYIDLFNEAGIFEVWKSKHIESYYSKYIIQRQTKHWGLVLNSFLLGTLEVIPSHW